MSSNAQLEQRESKALNSREEETKVAHSASHRAAAIGRVTRASQFGPIVAAAIVYCFFAVVTWGHGFTTVEGTASWLNTASQLGIIAVPMALLMIAGEFDLSVGSMVASGAVTIAVVTGYYEAPILVGAATAAALAVVVGLANGLMVTRTGLPSFIVTLASNLILAGLALVVSKGIVGTTTVPVTGEGSSLDLFAGSWGAFNVSILWWALFAILGGLVLAKRRFGNWVFATGGNAENARRAGVPTARVKITLFVGTALGSALVGIIQALQYFSGEATSGQGYVFQAPIVVVIGGVLLAGGYGSISGVVIATLLYGFVSAGLFYTGWDTNYTQVVIGTLMVVAVLTNEYIRRLAFAGARPSKRKGN